jgi:hypothetical protein
MEEENKNYFKTYEDWYESDDYHEYRGKVVDLALDIMADAWILGVNLAWVRAKFENNEKAEIYKYLIRQCYNYEWHAEHYCLTEDDRELIGGIKKRNQADLYSYLAGEIYDYCVNM